MPIHLYQNDDVVPVSPTVLVLMYHRIAPMRRESIVPGHYVSPKLFRRQIKWLHQRGYQSMSVIDVAKRMKAREPLPPRTICITFDDAFRNVYENALPILEEFHMTGTIYPVTDTIGGINAWNIPEGDIEEPMMTAEQILDSRRRGFEIGSHTATHPHLNECSEEKIRDELVRSKLALEKLLDEPIPVLCYPYGGENSMVRDIAREVGYAVATSTRKGAWTALTDPYLVPRINVRSDTWPVLLGWKIKRSLRGTR